jgi:hypothetical protein
MTSSIENYSSANNPAPPHYLGSRYNSAGEFLPDPGNTVVCHVVPGSRTEAVLLEVRRRIMEEASGSLAFTAPESLHMTLFQGILDRRRSLPYWPQGVALDTPVAATTELFRERLQDFMPGPSFAVEATAVFPSGIIVDGVTAADRHALADWRNRLADVFGYRHPDHDSYEFHITYAYPIRWFEPAEIDGWRMLMEELLISIRLAAPVLELRPPALCSFEDMNWFEELLTLDAKVPA